MSVLDQSGELIGHSGVLRARASRLRGAVDVQVADSRRLLAAGAEARAAVRHAHGWESAERWPRGRAEVAGSVTAVDSDPAGSTWPDAEYVRAMLRESQALRQMSREARARARAIRHQSRLSRSQREAAATSAFIWLLARLKTMPVIEQAKGIIMGQQRCGPEEAFGLLVRASQRANVKLNVLAAQIVQQTAASGNNNNVTPITLGITRYSPPGTPAGPPGNADGQH